MIYTLTLAPSLDYSFFCEAVKVGKINHAHHPLITPGGKGVNVSFCLNNLHVENMALGFSAGWTGRIIENQLKEDKVNFDFIEVEGNSRINVKVKEETEETAFNLDGPVISENDLNKLYERLDKLEFGDILIMGGSTGMAHRSLYDEIISKYNKKGILCVLDASGQALKEGVKAKPFLIKPNIDELSGLVGRTVSPEEVPDIGKQIVAQYGINYVLVSLGKDGACLITPNNVYKDKFSNKSYRVVSTVGAGDSMLAGFLTKLSQGRPVEECLHFGNVCGSSKCYLGHFPSLEELEQIQK